MLDENMNFETYRTSPVSEEIQTKQSVLSSKVSNNHQIPNQHNKTVILVTIEKIAIVIASYALGKTFAFKKRMKIY